MKSRLEKKVVFIFKSKNIKQAKFETDPTTTNATITVSILLTH